MKITKILKDTLIPTVWNGGETFEYYIYPENSLYINRDFLFRISAASITKVPSAFTKFNDYKRFLVMLDTNLHIKHNNKDEHYKTSDIFKFNSNSDIVSYTKGNDFNLMVSNNVENADVFFLDNVAQLKQSFIFIFALNDTLIEINNKKSTLKKNDLLLIENKEKANVYINTKNKILVGSLSLTHN